MCYFNNRIWHLECAWICLVIGNCLVHICQIFFIQVRTVYLEKIAKFATLSLHVRKLCKGFILQISQYFPLKGKIVPRQTIFSEPIELQPDFASESAFLSAGSHPSCVLLCDSSVADKQHDKDKWPRWFPNTGHRSKLCNLSPSLLRLCQQSPCDVWVREEVVEKRCSPFTSDLSYILCHLSCLVLKPSWLSFSDHCSGL